MNPFDLSASELMVWGLVLHLIADWPLQNDWMATNKTKAFHPAGIVHAGIHAFALSWIFGWVALPIALTHYVIDFRWPVALWSRMMRQTQPGNHAIGLHTRTTVPLYDIGSEVRIWNDQVFHIVCIAIAALVVAG